MKEFVKAARKKGWTAKALAGRWGVTPQRITQISGKPSQKDLDALAGLPVRAKNFKTE